MNATVCPASTVWFVGWVTTDGATGGGVGTLPESTRKNSCAAPPVTGLVQLKFPFASKVLVATADQFVAASARFVADITRYVASFEPPMPASTMLPELS